MSTSSPCNKANQTCDKSQYKECSLWDKIKLSLHLLYCKTCRNYSAKNAKLTEAMEKAKVECMDNADKKCLEEAFKKALKEQQNSEN